MFDFPEFEDLKMRVQALEEKVSELEQQKGKTNFIPKMVTQTKPAPVSELELKPKTPVDWEHVIGRVWLPRIFIFVFLFGVIWGFKAAADYGWIRQPTPPIRCAAGGIVSLILFFWGEREVRKTRRVLGQTLIGGGVILLMISTFAAHYLYHLIGPSVAFGCNIAWILLGVFFSHRHKSESLAILSSSVGALIPFLIDAGQSDVTELIVFETVLYGVFLLLSFKKNFRILFFTSAGMFHLSLLISAIILAAHNMELVKGYAFAAIIQHFLLLTFYLVRNKMGLVQTGLYFSSFFATLIWMYVSLHTTPFKYVLLSLVVFYLILSFFSIKQFIPIEKDKPYIFFVFSAYAGFIYLIDACYGKDYLVLTLILESCLTLWVSQRTRSSFQNINGWILYGVSFIGFIPYLVESINQLVSLQTITWVVFIVSIGFIKKFILSTDKSKGIQMILTIVIGALCLVFITHVADYFTRHSTDNIQHLSVSFVWALYAVLSVVFGLIRKHAVMQRFGIILIFVTLAKVCLVDFPAVSIFIRAILFLGLGVFGLLMSRMFYIKKEKEDS